MFAIICRRRLRRVFISPQLLVPQDAVFNKSFSSKKSSFAVNGDNPKQSFTISYLINTCGLSSNNALSVSQRITFKSPENPDSVLELLRKYGFTNANISRLITRWPNVLSSCPKKTLLPKLEFFSSIGVPLNVLAVKLSTYPLILQRSLENYLIPFYDYLKTLLQSDKRVVTVFARAPRAFAHGWERELSSNIAILRQRGIPESSITTLMANQPSVFLTSTEKLVSCIDRAAGMGIDGSKLIFIHALEAFVHMSESTLKHKMEVYRRCGWSESDVSSAFSKQPLCMRFSAKKIMVNMDFLVNYCGCKPDAVSRQPSVLGLNLDKRLKPRYLVARVLKEKGLLKKRIGVLSFMKISEEKFLKRYIVHYQEDVPELLDIYRGKLSVPEMGISQQVIFR